MIHPFFILLFIDIFLCSWFPPKPIVLSEGQSYDNGNFTVEVFSGTGVVVSRQGCKLEETFEE
jgi:hypothetical protein